MDVHLCHTFAAAAFISKEFEQYATNLKSRYKAPPLRNRTQLPFQVTKKFFNLALIKEETVRKGEISDKFTRLTITGKVEDILKCKVPISLHDVFKNPKEGKREVILFEGSPGSGKTVLSLHLCCEWSDGNLFKNYTLVILVRLREPAIHTAQNIKDILPRVGMEEDVAKEIVSARGSGIVFIFDGWDELPEDVPGYAIIETIITGEALPKSTIVITSQPTSSGNLHDTNIISSRIEILGFNLTELREYFIEHLDGNTSKVDTLLLKIKANPKVAGTCALPLNASILVHAFKYEGHLPRTEHGIFDALIRSCILRHLKERTQHKIKAIKSLTHLPHTVQSSYFKLCEIAYEGVMDNRVIFELPEDFDTLGLLQGVECYSSFGAEYFYNFLHLTMQEFLAAQHIATTFEATKQVATFEHLFGQARFSSTFQHYSAITKLATPGIDEIIKKCAAGYRNSDNNDISHEEKVRFVSLLNCLFEVQDPALYQLVADNFGQKLDLSGTTLNPADCLSIGYFMNYITDFEANLNDCSICDEGCKMLFSQDHQYHLCFLEYVVACITVHVCKKSIANTGLV